MSGAVLERPGAGSPPTRRVHPLALASLRAEGSPVTALQSKSWDRLALDGAPEFELVITVRGAAAAEPCPVWPGAPRRLHWSLDDPAAASEAQKRRVFGRVLHEIEARVRDFAAPLTIGNEVEPCTCPPPSARTIRSGSTPLSARTASRP